MTERPILFSGPMVRALIEGRKTQTRRVVKMQPANGCHYEMNGAQSAACHLATEAYANKQWDRCYVPALPNTESHLVPCPYGKPGDRLWVRETFSPWRRTSIEYPMEWEGLATTEERGGLTLAQWVEEYGHHDIQKCYLADQKTKGEDVYIPSIHMPRWASRITLEVTEVRVQRLQEISGHEAYAEGFGFPHFDPECKPGTWMATELSMIDNFASYFRKLNGDDVWDANPWVWAVSFKREAK